MSKGKWDGDRYKAKILLSCHCEREFVKPWPQLMEELWCPRHNDKVTVIRTPDTAGNFGWKCECGTGRTYGADKERCENRAAAHHAKHPEQTIRLYNGFEEYDSYVPPKRNTVLIEPD